MATSTIKATTKIVVENYTGLTATISANSTYTNTSIDISGVVPSGYSPVEVWAGATGNYSVYAYNCLLTSRSTGIAQVQLRNTSNASVTVTPQFRVLCVKE